MRPNETPGLSETEETLASLLTDLCYCAGEEMLAYLEHVGYIQQENNGKHLRLFLDVVAFILFWMERAGLKRVFGAKRQAWDRAFSMTKTDWGAFFSEYPEGPTLEDTTGRDIAKMLSQQCEGYDRLYRKKLENRGSLHARNACCAHLLEKICALTGPKGKKFSEATNEAVCHHVGRAVQDIGQQMDGLMLENPL